MSDFPPPHYFDAHFCPTDSRLKVSDMPDGRTRVIETGSYADGDFRELRPWVGPCVLDLAERRVVLDMWGRHADVDTKWRDGALSVRDRLQRFNLTADLAGGPSHEDRRRFDLTVDLARGRFRDAAAPDTGWQPIDGLQAWMAARVPTLDEAFPPLPDVELPTYVKPRLTWTDILAIALFALMCAAWIWWG